MKILYFGSDLFSSTVLCGLVKRFRESQRFPTIDVCVSHANPSKKEKLLKYVEFTKNLDLKHVLWEDYEYSTRKKLLNCGSKVYDYGLVASFGKMIPAHIINSFKKTMLNVHPSMLPQYRGASPIQYALMNMDKYTGVSILDVSPHKMDRGDVYSQKLYEIPKHRTFGEIKIDLANLGADMLYDVITNYDAYQRNKMLQKSCDAYMEYVSMNYKNSLEPPGGLVMARKLKETDFYIDWYKESSSLVYGKYRAFYDGYSRLKTFFQNKPLYLDNVKIETHFPTSLLKFPGAFTINHSKTKFYIYCKDGVSVSVTGVKFGFTKMLNPLEFYTGYIRSHKKDCFFSNFDKELVNT